MTDRDDEQGPLVRPKTAIGSVGVAGDDESAAGYVDDSKLTVWDMVVALVFHSPMNLFLALLVPLALAADFLNWGLQWTFLFGILAIIPLSVLLGHATEQLALHFGPIVGGLLNATFSNVVELIVAAQALKRQDTRLVQTSLLGSILSNALLCLGCAVVAAGKSCKFNREAASANSNLLALMVFIFVLPVTFSHTMAAESNIEAYVLDISRSFSILGLFIYLLYLAFQLVTHRHLFLEADDEEPVMTTWFATLTLAVLTLIVAVMADYVVEAVEHVANSWGMTPTFIGIILIPLVGNAAEHVTSITMAWRGKIDLGFSVVLGSCSQIAAMVLPVSVLIGWCFNVNMSLSFQVLDAVVIISATALMCNTTRVGSSNWLEGACLVAAYVLCAMTYFFTDDRATRH